MALNLVILTIPKIIFEGKTMVREDIFVPHQKVLSKKKKPLKAKARQKNFDYFISLK